MNYKESKEQLESNSIILCGFQFRVSFDYITHIKSAEDLGSVGCWGTFQAAKALITIHTDAAVHYQKVTLIHELCHLVDYLSNPSNIEFIVICMNS